MHKKYKLTAILLSVGGGLYILFDALWLASVNIGDNRALVVVYILAQALIVLGILTGVYAASTHKKRDLTIAIVVLAAGFGIYQYHEMSLQARDKKDCLAIADQMYDQSTAANIRASCYKQHGIFQILTNQN